MKTILIIFALTCSWTTIASINPKFQLQTPISSEETTLEKSILLFDENGITIYGDIFSHEGRDYIILKFKNTTNESIHFLWSIKVKGRDLTINMDGTTQAYLSIPSGKSVIYGEFNSEDPLIEVDSTNFEKEIKIHVEF